MTTSIKTSLPVVGLLGLLAVCAWHFRPSTVNAHAVVTPSGQGAIADVDRAAVDAPVIPSERTDLPAEVAALLPAQANRTPLALAPMAELEPLSPQALEEALTSYFSMNDEMLAATVRGFAHSSCLTDPDVVRRRYGADLSDEDVDVVLQLSAGYNTDVQDLAELYALDYKTAMHDTLRGGHFSLEEPGASGGFRDQLPGESRVRFPGMAAYYTINQVRYPQLEQHRQARRQLVESRDREIWAYLRRDR